MSAKLLGSMHMKGSGPPTPPNRRTLASSIQQDFRALVDVLGHGVTDGELRSQLTSAKASAERGLELANRLLREIDSGTDPESR